MKPYLLLYMLRGRFGDLYSSPSCDMDGSVWHGLPPELIARVLQMLPAASQFRFRSVSKQWRAILDARTARPAPGLPVRGASHFSSPLLCAFQIKPGQYEWGEDRSATSPHRTSFCTSQYTVHRIDLDFLPPWAQVSQRQVRGHQARCKRFVVAKDGLICLRGRERDPEGFITRCAMCVFNPLTKACKELPHLDLPPELPWTLKLEVDRGSAGGGFRVFVVCTTEENSFYHFWVLCVYSSRTDCWTITQCEPIPADTVKHNPEFDFVVCNGVLYRYGAGHLLVHRIDDQSFQWHAGARMPAVNELDSQFYLLEYNGTVHFVGQVWHGDLLTYGIWKLDALNTVWVQVSLLPEEILEKLGGSHRGEEQWKSCKFLHNSLVAGDFIFLVVQVEYSKLRSHLVAFSLLEGTWEVFLRNEPSYPFFIDSYGFVEPLFRFDL